ncbi:SubName: Full=Uncharacterized protein {ECO:0000313/EMBL:CCA72271.1} [Serendipita indica DSM 11827]|nr:SubName: Full=Uncharacterized protein {ECO:0000313/EMBL:CCA72271.1} [Serendipita indica DSM 11827]
MDSSLLDGWLALAAETRRVDRISSTLGLDFPSTSTSPSSLGSSSGSSGLNTPSQNAFRFLSLLKDMSPELLESQSPSLSQSPSPPLSRQRSGSYHRHTGLSIPKSTRTVGRPPISLDTTSPPSFPEWRTQRQFSKHPYAYSPSPEVQRSSMHSGRHLSYPIWPAHQPISAADRSQPFHAPLITYSAGSPTNTTGLRSSRTVSSRNPGGLHASENEFGYVITDSISPMLSEPFHRLIVNDEEDEVREARPLGSTAPERHAQITNDAEMKTVAEEDENAGDWW